MVWQIAAAALVGGSGLASAYNSRRAAKYKGRALELSQRSANIENMRALRQQIRAQRLAAAETTAAAEATGTRTSSSYIGGQSSLHSQLGSGLHFAARLHNLNVQRNKFLRKSGDASSRAATFQGIASIFSSATFANIGGGGGTTGGGGQGTV